MINITNNFYEDNNACGDNIEEVSVHVYSKEKGNYIAKRRLLSEHYIKAFINEKEAFSLVCTASDIQYLIVGRLLSESLITTVSEIDNIYICSEGTTAKIYLVDGIEFSSSINEIGSCCSDNRQNIIRENSEMSKIQNCIDKYNDEELRKRISSAISIFDKDTKLHKMTSGTHSCYLVREKELIYAGEDIGRHNAMDKAIGYMYANDIEADKCLLFTTGRVPIDMVRKAINAKIPVLVSKSVPTKEAIDMADKYGLILVGRAWPDSFEIY